MALEKVKSSVLGLFNKEDGSPSFSIKGMTHKLKKEKRLLAKKATRKMESIFGLESASTRLQVKMLRDEIMAKGRSLPQQIYLLKMEKETPDHLLLCSICCSPYSKARLPLVGTCGHTICRHCVQSIRRDDCPICRAVDSFSRPVKNFLAYDLLEQTPTFPHYERGGEEDAEPHRKDYVDGVLLEFGEELVDPEEDIPESEQLEHDEQEEEIRRRLRELEEYEEEMDAVFFRVPRREAAPVLPPLSLSSLLIDYEDDRDGEYDYGEPFYTDPYILQDGEEESADHHLAGQLPSIANGNISNGIVEYGSEDDEEEDKEGNEGDEEEEEDGDEEVIEEARTALEEDDDLPPWFRNFIHCD